MFIRKQRQSTWRISVPKPAGGFVFIRAEDILKVWHSFQLGRIQLYDVRVWLSCHELVARRCCMNHKLKPSYRTEELYRVLNAGSPKRIRQSLSRLEAASLLHWKTESINLRTGDFPLEKPQEYAWQEKLNLVQNWRRKVPVPRRVIRYLAASRRKVLIAVLLGHLLRCVYYRNEKCVSGGRCKASWIAEVFGVDVRNVKAVRKEVIDQGWLRPLSSSQMSLNRWGKAVIVNLNHSFRSMGPQAQSPPRLSSSRSKSSPLYNNRKLSTRFGNHKLLQSRKPGAQMGEKKKKQPYLKRLLPDDLQNPARLNALYGQATETGILPAIPATRLQWFAAAERALERGTRNPCGLFVSIFQKKLWHHITDTQEDAARVKLAKLDYGEDVFTRYSD